MLLAYTHMRDLFTRTRPPRVARLPTVATSQLRMSDQSGVIRHARARHGADAHFVRSQPVVLVYWHTTHTTRMTTGPRRRPRVLGVNRQEQMVGVDPMNTPPPRDVVLDPRFPLR